MNGNEELNIIIILDYHLDPPGAMQLAPLARAPSVALPDLTFFRSKVVRPDVRPHLSQPQTRRTG